MPDAPSLQRPGHGPGGVGRMTPNLRPYSEMKESGVEELGAVPAHWEVRKLGQIGRLSKGSGGSKEDEVPTGCPCVRYGDLYTSHRHFIQDSRSFVSSEKTRDYTRIQYGDVLFAASGETIDEIGKSAVNLIRRKAYCGGDIILFRANRQVDTRFLGYVTDCRPTVIQKARMGRGITVMHIYGDRLKHLSVPLPPVSEQTAIVRFLGYADRRIRQYMRGKEKLIALLEEQRGVIIETVVTGKFDVRTGAPYERYKDSGTPWVGKVPEHWKVQAAKWFFREIDERSESGTEELLSVSHITGVTPRSQKKVTMFRAESNVGDKLCQSGDLVVNTMWAWMAALGITRQSGIVSPSYAVYRPHPSSELLGSYADLLLRTAPYKSEYMCRSTGIRPSRLRLYPDQFLSIKLLCPPPEEQYQIVEFVNQASLGMQRLKESLKKQHTEMSGFHTRLIADVVTGKLDVREAAAALPEGDDLDEDADDGPQGTFARNFEESVTALVQSEA